MIVVGSDGLFDNVFDDDIVQICNKNYDKKNMIKLIGEDLIKTAFENSQN